MKQTANVHNSNIIIKLQHKSEEQTIEIKITQGQEHMILRGTVIRGIKNKIFCLSSCQSLSLIVWVLYSLPVVNILRVMIKNALERLVVFSLINRKNTWKNMTAKNHKSI